MGDAGTETRPTAPERQAGDGRLVTDERGALAPLFLMVMVGLVGAILVFIQLGHSSVLATESNTASDAAALAGGQELADQLIGLDRAFLSHAPSLIDRDRICNRAADYAARNDATLTSCSVDVPSLTVTVEVKGDVERIGGPLESDPEHRPVSRAAAQVGLPTPTGGIGGIGGGGSGPRDVSHSALAPEYQEMEPPEILLELIQYATWVHEQRMPYVWGGGHQSSPAPRDGPFDCSGAVSALLQTVYPDFPTSTSPQYVGVGENGRSPSDLGVTIYAYPGHVFINIGGRGWGTGSGGHTAGAGWLNYDHASQTTTHSHAHVSHIPALEPQNAEQEARIRQYMEEHGPAGPGDPGGGGGTIFAPNVRLVSSD